MDHDLLGNFETDSSLSVFAPERPGREMDYCALRCACGVAVFRLTGWPRVLAGRGGYFWRSVARVWREARLPTQDGDEVASPFWLPISACCDGCGKEETLFDGARVMGRKGVDERAEPKESVRCRGCRRGLVEIVVGVARGAGAGEWVGPDSDVEVVSRCHRCHRQSRLAWSVGQRSEQEIQLDILYGRQ